MTNDLFSSNRRGLTLIKTVVIIVIVVVVFAWISSKISGTTTQLVTIKGQLVSPSATIPAGGSQTYTYSMTLKRGPQPAGALSGRAVTFRVAPSYVTLNTTSGTTDINGEVTVTLSAPVDSQGAGGNLWVKDTTSGVEDPPHHFTIN